MSKPDPSPLPANSPPGVRDEELSERRSLRDCVIILRERFWIALPLALLVSIGLGYYRSSQVPLFQAHATMQFEKPATYTAGPQISNPGVTRAADLNTYLQVIASGELKKRVIKSLTPSEVRILQRPFLAELEPGQEPPSVGSVLGSLDVGDVRDSCTNLIGNRLVAADQALTSARLQRLQVEGLLKQVETFSSQGRDMFEISYISGHGSVAALHNQLDELRKNQSILAERYLERHPRMIDVANEIAVTEQQLSRSIELAIADLRTTYEKAQSSEKSMQHEYDLAELDQRRLRDLSTEYKSLLSQAEIARNNFRQITERLADVDIEKRTENVPVRPLDRAGIPGAAYTPDIPGIVKSSVMIFFLVFVGVAVGLSFVDDRIKSAWDVEHFIGVNLLGIVPDLSSLKDEEKYSLVLENRQVPGTESFLSIYSAVKIHSKLDFPKSILVTSTIPGEGKTLISCNLAGGFARHGRKTLLVDCDLRRPMLHRHFQKENDKGLITWYEAGGIVDGQMSTNLDLGILKIGENLSLLRSGGRSRVPTELLESSAFAQVLERLQKEYELIIVDTPPLGAVTDSLMIAEHVDEVIYVCRFNRAYRKHIRQYVVALQSAKREMLGIVLNGLSPRRIEYYSNYRYYRSYKKYYGAES